MVRPDFKTCHQCQKEFLVALPKEWVYRVEDNRIKFFCSYTCIQNYRKKKEEEKKQQKINYALYRRAKSKKGGQTVG